MEEKEKEEEQETYQGKEFDIEEMGNYKTGKIVS